MAPWFSLLTPNLEGFFRLPERLSVQFPRLRPDLKKFGNELVQTGGFVFAPLPTLLDLSRNYFQFDVWIGRGKAWEKLASRALAWAYKSEIVDNPPSGEQEINVVEADVSFSSILGVRVLCSKPIGQLGSPHILRPKLVS
jgi:hypothetical protein